MEKTKCKPILGLNLNCKLATGLSKNCTLILGQVIHHSDRGIQYCSYNYTDLLKENNIKISMTESGDPLENPLAERINGILKLEYMEHYKNKNVEEAKKNLIESVKLYNSDRPHFSINLLTPNYVHNNENAKTENLWKKQNVNLF